MRVRVRACVCARAYARMRACVGVQDLLYFVP
jgi:hypothetical protein